MNRAVFLDRDGVINEVLSKRVKFVNTPQQFHLLKGVGPAIKQLNDAKFKVFVVTNQGGIGLGYMKEKILHAVHEKMEADLAVFGAKIDGIAYCAHKPHANCRCRKPKPQMLLDLAKEHEIDLSESYLVGDRKPDIEAGRGAGVYTILVGNRDETVQADQYFADLQKAAKWIINRNAG